MTKSLEGKIAVVTGGSRGIGKGIAIALAKAGASVMINGTNLAKLEEAKAEIEEHGRKCQYLQGDITEETSRSKLAEKTLADFGKIDILVNNAGIIDRDKTLSMSDANWLRVMDVNLNSVFFLSKLVLAEMVKQNSGNVINISSGSAVAPHPNASPSYGASKAAINYLTKHFAMEFAPNRIRVNAIQCGPIASEMSDQWSEDYRAKTLAKIPLGHLGTPADVGAAACFLASDEAGFITGTCLNLSGGKLMYG